MKYSTSLAALAMSATLCSPLWAGIIVNDTWRDGDDNSPAAPLYSEFGTDSDADGDLESAWFQGGDGTLNPVGAGGPLRGQFSTATSASSASWTTYFTPEGSELNLGAVGSSVKVTWVFTPTNIGGNAGATNNTSQNFRLALVDSPAALRLAAAGAPASGAYNGYGMFMNMSPTLGNNNPFRIMERTGATGALLSGSGDWTGLANGATSGNTGYVGGTEYTFVMTLTRNATSGIDVTATMSGGSLNNSGLASAFFSDATPNNGSFQFDTFSLRPSGATTTAEAFDTRLFRVDYTVPEPSTVALCALAGLGLLAVRRGR